LNTPDAIFWDLVLNSYYTRGDDLQRIEVGVSSLWTSCKHEY